MTIESIRLDTKQAKQYAAFLKHAPEITRHEMKQGLTEILLLLEREIKDDTPVGVGGGGGLRGSITHNLRGISRDTLRGKVFSPLSYAQSVEYGTKPHLPPFTALMDWVEAKLGITDPKEVVGVAVKIALKIKAHGTEGAHMFEQGFNNNRQQINARLNRAIDNVLNRLQTGKK